MHTIVQVGVSKYIYSYITLLIECTILEKDRDGCVKIVNLGSSKLDLAYQKRQAGQRSNFNLG